MRQALPLLAVAAVVGCSGATTGFSRTGPTIAAQPDGCDFAVMTAPPSEPYTELGYIDIKYTSQMDWIHDEAAFKRKVRPLVCQNGGDAAIAHTNSNGLYVKATVVSTKPIAAPAAPAAAEPASAAEAVEQVAAPAPPAVEKTAQTEPAKKEDVAKKEDIPKPETGKKGSKKGAAAKKDDDIRGKDGKIDIDKLL
jgi:hypothetical protein